MKLEIGKYYAFNHIPENSRHKITIYMAVVSDKLILKRLEDYYSGLYESTQIYVDKIINNGEVIVLKYLSLISTSVMKLLSCLNIYSIGLYDKDR